ncbi:MAG TPA: CHC2 zinc finger domain-containing protein, partial [Dehalococcoidia bacterium]|nr:CHC2 zinc finger domain-containing protein [Dehalococcoidia bacterium]
MSAIDEIKQRIDIVDLIGETVRLQRAGRNFKGLCP